MIQKQSIVNALGATLICMRHQKPLLNVDAPSNISIKLSASDKLLRRANEEHVPLISSGFAEVIFISRIPFLRI